MRKRTTNDAWHIFICFYTSHKRNVQNRNLNFCCMFASCIVKTNLKKKTWPKIFTTTNFTVINLIKLVLFKLLIEEKYYKSNLIIRCSGIEWIFLHLKATSNLKVASKFSYHANHISAAFENVSILEFY